ncbi:MAG: hypothetical protein ACKUBY_03735 [Candidatus Moraniibacteriota bacterium]|jgi:soluble cytochrome b562
MNKKIVILSVAMFAIVALTGCGESDTSQADVEKEIAGLQDELATQQVEIDEAKADLEKGAEMMVEEAEKLEEQSCAQQLELKKTQLVLLDAHVAALENLEGKVEQSPDFAIETCRNLNPGLSVPECSDKVDVFMEGKNTELTETQEQVTLVNAEITELETQCGTDTTTDATATTNAVK